LLQVCSRNPTFSLKVRALIDNSNVLYVLWGSCSSPSDPLLIWTKRARYSRGGYTVLLVRLALIFHDNTSLEKNSSI
jgi:hypothetical protein